MPPNQKRKTSIGIIDVYWLHKLKPHDKETSYITRILENSHVMAKYYNRGTYDTRPYHALALSDGEEEDDDICVWKDRAEPPELPEPYESEDEPLFGHLRDTGSDIVPNPNKSHTTARGNNNKRPRHNRGSRQHTESKSSTVQESQKSKSEEKTVTTPKAESSTASPKISREQEISNALVAAHKSLTRMSQFILKLEARTGKVTKEGIRYTLDATVRDNTREFGVSGGDADHKSEIDEIKDLSAGISHRLWLVDRHLRHQDRLARHGEASSSDSSEVRVHGERFVRDFLKVETRTSHLAAEEKCFYTGHDLANGRSVREWVQYLRKVGKFRDTTHDESKLVELAWCFLDRNLRGPSPPTSASTSIDAFVLDLETKKKNGAFIDVMQNPDMQVEQDREAWIAMKRCWSSRTFP
ncbi:hypothetical protein F4810DRAFT_726700 [Camillea tinctor]|nr:hypothetical protein F4810DRAFT_726700 [Camillea tinctor]